MLEAAAAENRGIFAFAGDVSDPASLKAAHGWKTGEIPNLGPYRIVMLTIFLYY